MDRTAYIDEAFSAGPVGAYVVAAVLVPSGRADGLRLELRHLFRDRKGRFHWHHEKDSFRLRMLEFIGDAGVAAVSVSTCLRDAREQERARGLAIDRLLWEMRTHGPAHLILESRQERNDQRDRRRIMAAQKAGKASVDLTYGFGRPDGEPLLWLADAVASAVLAAEFGDDRAITEVVGGVLTRIKL